MDFKNEDILTADQFDQEAIRQVLELAREMEEAVRKKKVLKDLRGRIMATLFFEPSTRTRTSFEAAMLRLGGQVISTQSMEFSSIKKGETLEDTIKIVGQYCDLIVIRHPEKGSAKRAAEATDIPVINAGDGPGDHPTQALLDLCTIKKEKGRLDDLTVAFVGDLKYGRTVHSLAKVLAQFRIKFIFVSPPELKMPEEDKVFLRSRGIEFQETEDLEAVISQTEVLYVTRIQKERFKDFKEYERLKGSYVINNQLLKSAKEDLAILHPLPRIDEIAVEVDKDIRRASYFRQAENGLFVRMALIKLILKG